MTLQEALNTTLSPDAVKKMEVQELFDYLVKQKLVKSEDDVKMLIIEGIQKAFEADDEFPITYYNKNEEIPEENKFVDPGPCLTDDYIANNLME